MATKLVYGMDSLHNDGRVNMKHFRFSLITLNTSKVRISGVVETLNILLLLKNLKHLHNCNNSSVCVIYLILYHSF